ncbi:Acetyltransferase (GNAT) family protein [Proteiniborus ethanoligenes]|uniref:Acetyltransferase (GNAT) family protein n=1 Tax=Proteiniborus ethanoligenes TaxID=415015 RepID=A0A1H3LQL2_9FIRM|nr:GNAT family N-acetyltransferase [Proteiniborus ethanoligenes]SDY66610.1 Acetyltransferase (GNAT) family protein [Proteiniborus ethanoligenes]
MNRTNNFFFVEEDYFNTQHFGIRMGNVKTKTNFISESKENLIRNFDEMVSKSKEEGYKHLTFKVGTNQKEIIKCAMNEGMEIADTLVRYVFDFSKSTLPQIYHKCSLKDCTKDDINALKEISRNSFKIDRFHSDDNLPNELCDLYYDKWIENSYNGYADKVIVAHYNNEAVGFTTGRLDLVEGYGQLVLSAVSDKYRGIGVYTSMIYHGVEWLMKNRNEAMRGVIVGTQIDNIAVQKSWIKLGFTIFDSQYVFQKYFG